MSRRIVLGKVNSSDHGLFVSKSGVDIVDSSGNLTSAGNQLFNSKFGDGNFTLKRKGQVAISGGSSSGTSTTITHNLGYRPLTFIQFCYGNELSSGVATKMRTPYMHLYNASGPLVSGNFLGGFFVYNFGLSVVINTNNITLTNHGYNLGSTSSTVVGKYVDSNKIGTIYVAYLIFATSV
tara:strand:+ start:1534 stop:2073 length:540 start_codon:yes stop_codon:yes gene_type:complete